MANTNTETDTPLDTAPLNDAELSLTVEDEAATATPQEVDPTPTGKVINRFPDNMNGKPIAEQVELFMDWARRNPLVKTYNQLGEATASNWRQHKKNADAIALELATSDLFVLVQEAPKGFWITEWTVIGHGKTEASRRRAAFHKSFPKAAAKFAQEVSYHSSHWFKQEEGWRGLYNRL